MEEWTEPVLWEKARLFMQRALEADREGPLFPFWAALSLELLARSALARVHPALLADPREPDNILAVFGYRTSDRALSSIPAKAVFSRCAVVVPNFTTDDAKFCQRIASLRNEELHSGNAAFADYPTGQWLGDYYRVCELLLTYLDKDLKSLLGDSGEVKAAKQLIKATQTKIEKAVKDSIAAKRRYFEQMDETERRERVTLASSQQPSAYQKRVSCPSCDSPCILEGDVVSVSGPRTVEDGVEREVVILPTKLTCQACDLQLRGLSHLYAARRDLAGQFTDATFESPEDFYGIDIGPQYDVELEYDNE
jgi:RNase P subunit RPR2